MTSNDTAGAAPPLAAQRGVLALSSAAFFASGFAALLYQIVWQRLLTFFGGADVYSVTIIVAAFMAGLGLGSVAGGHLADRLSPRRRFLAFALAETAIALFAFLSVSLFYDVLYQRLGGSLAGPGVGLLLFATLLWPTFFMGMSLPLLARAVAVSAEASGEKVGALYGWNTLGAAVGSMVTVWVLVRSLGFRGTVEVGAWMNLACAGVAFLLAASATGRAAETGPAASRGAGPTSAPVFPMSVWLGVYLLSGYLALSLEILWFRLLGIMLKSNSFTFGTLLAVFLVGVGLGALLGRRLARQSRRPALAFLALQAGITLYAGLSIAVFVHGLGRHPWLDGLFAYMGGYEPLELDGAVRAGVRWMLGDAELRPYRRHQAALLFQLYGVVPAALILPPTLFMGASFPLLQKAVQTDLRVLGRRVGWLQGANIAGSTLGAVVTGLLLLHWLGSAATLRLLVGLGSFFLLLLSRELSGRRRRRAFAAAAVILTGLVVWVCPQSLTLWAMLHGTDPGRIHFGEDGSGLSLLKSDGQGGAVVFASGLGQSALPYGGYHAVLGALPTILHPAPRAVAVIGLGSGNTLFGAGGRPETETLDCIEIVGPQVRTLRDLARSESHPGLTRLLLDPRVRFTLGDGRAFLMRSTRRYDVIEADALRPTSAYAGNLYSYEFFLLVKSRLSPGGFGVTWAPTRRTHASFLKAFPHVAQFGDTLVGGRDPIAFDERAVRARLRDPAIRNYFTRGGVDIVALLDPLLAKGPVPYGPAEERLAVEDVNTDLYPRDEYMVSRSFLPGGRLPEGP